VLSHIDTSYHIERTEKPKKHIGLYFINSMLM